MRPAIPQEGGDKPGPYALTDMRPILRQAGGDKPGPYAIAVTGSLVATLVPVFACEWSELG